MPNTSPLGFTAPALSDAPNGPAQILTALGQIDDHLADPYTSYTPALTALTTSPTLGTGSVTSGRYKQVGSTVKGWAFVKFGTSGTAAGSGVYRLSLPPIAAWTGTLVVAGFGYVWDASASDIRVAVFKILTSTTVEIFYSGSTGGFVGHASPWAWTANDEIQMRFQYEAA